jgi:ABC-type nickel/cobalt efflux system permease component RcnA
MASFSILLLGLLVGLRHAFEPDHLAAVSTLVAEQRSPRAAAVLGAIWGLGHSLALLVVVTVLAALGQSLPPSFTARLELVVALMLIYLGIRTLVRAAKRERTGAIGVHSHGDRTHTHAHQAADHVHLGRHSFARRSLLVGLVHGLAGSGSLAALVAVEVPDLAGKILYVSVFGLGSVLGMALISGAAGWPLARAARHPVLARAVAFATGTLALVVGTIWAWPAVTGL